MRKRSSIFRTSYFLSALMAVTISQGQTASTRQKKSDVNNCSNIVALTGNININCSQLTPEQRKALEQIPAMLRRILTNENPPALMAKIDEILKAVSERGGGVSAPGGIAIGGQAHVENPTVNNFAPSARRLSADFMSSVSACLALHPGTVNISAMAGDAEAYQYAEDWLKVFSDANWNITDKVIHSFIVGQGDWSGTTIGVRGSGTTPDPNTPGDAAIHCLIGKGLPQSDKGKIVLYPDTLADHLAVTVGGMPVRSR